MLATTDLSAQYALSRMSSTDILKNTELNDALPMTQKQNLKHYIYYLRTC